MKTKQQKQQVVDEAKNLLKENKNLTFVDFTGVGVEDMRVLRRALRELGAQTKVIKKKLLRVALENNKIDFNPEQFEEQMATIFSSGELHDLASPIYKFFKEKEKKGFKILGAYDLEGKKFIDSEMVKMFGQLPSREILLAQLVGMLSMPIKMFMNVLNERAKVME